MLAVSQVLPGPNVVNLALMFGDRCFGLRGAFAALAGMLLAPMIIVLALTALYGHFAQDPVVTGALRGMGAVAAGLVIATGLKLLGTLKRTVDGPADLPGLRHRHGAGHRLAALAAGVGDPGAGRRRDRSRLEPGCGE